MPNPVRLQLSRRRGFDLQAHSRALNGLPAVSCARPHALGNPFPVDVYGQARAVDMFDRFFTGRMSTLEMSQASRADRWSDRGVSLVTVRQWMGEALKEARGHNLACWCEIGALCHVDMLLKCEAVR